MSKPHGANANILVVVSIALALAATVVFVVGMAVIMADHMDSGMMWRGGGGGAQTPIVSDQPQASVEIRDFDYFPRDLTVSAGGRVTWTNRDSAPHTATAEGAWDTGILNEDESATLTFDTPGRYDYICTLHPSMKAVLTVR